MTVHRLSDAAILHHADMREVLKSIPSDSLDSCVTDPPYHLTSIVKRFGGENAAPAQHGTDGAFARASKGFMGRLWDGGDIAFQVDTWVEVLRVLKPGAHLAAFGATRGYHRMACAIEDAGFEIRDSLAWLYGTGFPKSHDVSKGIDKTDGKQMGWFGPWLRVERERRGITQKELAVNFPSKTGGLTGCIANWELGLNIPTVDQFNTLCRVMSLPFEYLDDLEREVIGQRTTGIGTGGGSVAIMGDGNRDITKPRTPAAQEWEGWGTAIKPSFEPIVLARKPLSEGTVAANVLRWRTGALNIGASRIGLAAGETPYSYPNGRGGEGWHGRESLSGNLDVPLAGNALGRWPANVVTDGSDEVVAAFPSTKGDRPHARGGKHPNPDAMGWTRERADGHVVTGRVEPDGSAARFFYSAKASKADRNGSKHPTVKPISLMEWLATLITPPGGTILDPFAGSGTTGIAATRRGFRVVLCEREAEYVADIRNRFGTPRPVVDLATIRADIEAARAIAALQARLAVRTA